MAHDVALPQAKGPKLGFFMYPTAENASGRFDSLDPDNFKYTISAREITALMRGGRRTRMPRRRGARP